MKRARFTAPARREFLAEVAYYNSKEPGLGARFATAVEEGTARAVAFPFTGSPASKNTRRAFVKDFPFALVYRRMKTESSFLRWRITLVAPNTGICVFKRANKLLEPTCEAHAAQQSRYAREAWKK